MILALMMFFTFKNSNKIPTATNCKQHKWIYVDNFLECEVCKKKPGHME